jgi:hypothetical protein
MKAFFLTVPSPLVALTAFTQNASRISFRNKLQRGKTYLNYVPFTGVLIDQKTNNKLGTLIFGSRNMKHKILRTFVLCTLVLVLTGCTKKEFLDIDVAPQLKLVVVDSEGYQQEGATIKLYKTEDDFYSNTNSAGNGVSSADGTFIFKDLEERIYYFYVEKGDMNNYYEEVSFSAPLKINEIRKIQCTIR